MVKRILAKVQSSGVFLGSVTLAAIIGGATSAAVMAAIPNNKGVIQSCYDNTTGVVRVIDPPAGSCVGTESSLKWDQDGVKAYAHIVFTDNDDPVEDTFTLDTNRDKNINSYTEIYNNDVDNAIHCFDTKVSVKNINAIGLATGQADMAASVDPGEFASIGGDICPAGTDAVVSADIGSIYVTMH